MPTISDSLIGLIYTITVNLSSSDIQSLLTTRVQLIPALGPNTYINLINVSGYFKYNTTPYTGGSNVMLYVGNDDVLQIFTQQQIQSTQSVITTGWQGINNNFTTTGLINNPVEIGLLYQEGTNFTGGDSTINITVSYQYISV